MFVIESKSFKKRTRNQNMDISEGHNFFLRKLGREGFHRRALLKTLF